MQYRLFLSEKYIYKKIIIIWFLKIKAVTLLLIYFSKECFFNFSEIK